MTIPPFNTRQAAGILTSIAILHVGSASLAPLTQNSTRYQRRKKHIQQCLEELLGGDVHIQLSIDESQSNVTLLFDYANNSHNETEVPAPGTAKVGSDLESEVFRLMQHVFKMPMEIQRFLTIFAPFKS